MPTPSMAVNPTAIPFIPFGTAVVSVTGTGTTWTTGLTGWNVVTGASNSSSLVNGTQSFNQAAQQAQIVISPGIDPGDGTATITIANNTDAATCTLTVLGSTYVVPALVPGTLSATAAAGGATLSLAGIAGGIGPYSVQFEQAPDAGGVPGAWTNLGTASPATTISVSITTPGSTIWFRAVTSDSQATPATASTPAVSLTASTLSGADADLVVSHLLGRVGALEPGLTLAQSFRKILASAAGLLDSTSVPGFVLFRLSDGTEAFRVPAAGRTNVIDGANL